MNWLAKRRAIATTARTATTMIMITHQYELAHVDELSAPAGKLKVAVPRETLLILAAGI